MYLQHENRIVGWVLLLSLALRLLGVLEWSARKELHADKETLTGLYPGQPGRQAKRPSAELLLKAFQGVSLAIVEMAGQQTTHVTPLTALQKKLLELWELPSDL
jgi:transposase